MNTLNLQMFAEAGTQVTTSEGYVNAYDGTNTPFDAANTKVEMFYAQLAKRQMLPKNRGKSVEWRKWNTFDKAKELREGVIPTGQKFGMTYMTGALSQYGTYATVSDRLEMHAYDDVILGATEEMGSSAAETQETLIRDALLSNANVIYCDNINVETGAVASTPTAPNAMEASATVMMPLSS